MWNSATTSERAKATQALRRILEDVRNTGGEVKSVEFIRTADGLLPVVKAVMPSGRALLDLIFEKAKSSAEDPDLAEFARALAEPFNREPAERRNELVARRIHTFVQEVVPFYPEKEETFQHGSYTMRLGGDCDDHVILTMALAIAAGIPARVVPFMVSEDDPRHVAQQFAYGGEWHWAETTLPAFYGEHPFDALDRLGIDRPDVRS